MEHNEHYSHRFCLEVLVLPRFQRLTAETDFGKETSRWQTQIDPIRDLVFVAYFVREAEYDSLKQERLRPRQTLS